MNLRNYLHVRNFKCPLHGNSLGSVYEELTNLLETNKTVRKKQNIVEELLEQEKDFNSEILPGIAIPHLRIKKLKQIHIAIGLSIKGVKVNSSSLPLHLFFLEFSPPQEADKHILILSEIAKLASKIPLKSLLNEKMTSEKLYSKLLRLI